MRIQSSNKFCSALLGAAALLCIPSPSQAVPPGMGVIGPVELTEFFIADCGGFQVLADFTLTVPYVEHYNKQGELISTDYHLFSGETTYYNSTDHSISVSEEGGSREIARWNWANGTLADMGKIFKVTLPGQGVIFQMAGRIVFDLATDEILFQAGPKDLEEGNVSALCAAFAG